MAKVMTVAFAVPTSVDFVRQGDDVTTRPGVYWRVQDKRVVGSEVHLQLWPIDGHDVDQFTARAPRELPIRQAREYTDPRFEGAAR